MKYLLILILLPTALFALSVSPSIQGNSASDSVTVTIPINDIDTVQVYDAMDITGSDKIFYAYYDPNGALIDSATNSSNISKKLNGFYTIRLKSSNGSGTLGNYLVVVKVYFKGKWRAVGDASYQVIDEKLSTYFDYMLTHAYYDGGCNNCTQTFYTKSVGSNVVTDSIVVTESSTRKAKVTFNRGVGSTVITSIIVERF